MISYLVYTNYSKHKESENNPVIAAFHFSNLNPNSPESKDNYHITNPQIILYYQINDDGTLVFRICSY